VVTPPPARTAYFARRAGRAGLARLQQMPLVAPHRIDSVRGTRVGRQQLRWPRKFSATRSAEASARRASMTASGRPVWTRLPSGRSIRKSMRARSAGRQAMAHEAAPRYRLAARAPFRRHLGGPIALAWRSPARPRSSKQRGRTTDSSMSIGRDERGMDQLRWRGVRGVGKGNGAEITRVPVSSTRCTRWRRPGRRVDGESRSAMAAAASPRGASDAVGPASANRAGSARRTAAEGERAQVRDRGFQGRYAHAPRPRFRSPSAERPGRRGRHANSSGEGSGPPSLPATLSATKPAITGTPRETNVASRWRREALAPPRDAHKPATCMRPPSPRRRRHVVVLGSRQGEGLDRRIDDAARQPRLCRGRAAEVGHPASSRIEEGATGGDDVGGTGARDDVAWREESARPSPARNRMPVHPPARRPRRAPLADQGMGSAGRTARFGWSTNSGVFFCIVKA